MMTFLMPHLFLSMNNVSVAPTSDRTNGDNSLDMDLWSQTFLRVLLTVASLVHALRMLQWTLSKQSIASKTSYDFVANYKVL